MRNFYFTLFITLTSLSFSQQGDFLLTEHTPHFSNIDNSNFEIISDNQGQLCIANRSGVLKYDGEAWDFFKTPAAALSIAVDESNVVYVGCIGKIGLIDFKGRSIEFQPLIESDTIQDLFLETLYNDGKVFFMGSENLIVYDIQRKELKVHQDFFLNLYELDGKIYVNNSNYETFLVEEELQKIQPEKIVSYASSFTDGEAFVIDLNGKLLAYRNQSFKTLPQNEMIEERGFEVQEVKWINDSLFVCSTFENGLLFFNTKDPDYIGVTNYYSGLQDNQIVALHTDRNNGVWTAHQFGITQISPLFPAYSYAHFPGLDGSLISTNMFEDRLWITTSLGLYYFDSDTLFETKVYYEIEKSTTSSAKKEKRLEPDETNKKNERSEKPMIKRLFGKKKRAKENTKTDKSSDSEQNKGLFKSLSKVFEGNNIVEKVKGKLSNNTKYVRKTQKRPIDINYSFKKVQGANGKFLNVIPYKNKLLAISNTGVYEIVNNEAQIIIEEDIESFVVNDLDQLVLSTSYLAVKCYKLLGEVWVEQISQPTGDIVLGMASDDNGTLWLAGSNTLYKSQLTDSSFLLLDNYELNNAFLDEVNLFEILGKTYFINSQGYFYYDEPENSVKQDTQMLQEIGSPLNHLYDKNGNAMWLFTGKSWNRLDQDGQVKTFEYLGIFPDLRSINSSPDSDHIWLLTNSNDILQYNPNQSNYLSINDLFVRKVSNEKGTINQNQRFELSYDENYLSVQLSKPDYLGLLNPEFQYRLKGLNTQWSDWTKSKTIDFSFLPEGNYELLVRSKDSFGRIDESSALSFKVKPPYWQTPWFYAIQMIFFGSMVILSTRLNQNNSKNRFLSGALTILTLVLIIEFLQSAISSYFSFKSSPVIEFLIDAIIAFMIFPLEKILRELMTKGRFKVGIKQKEATSH